MSEIVVDEKLPLVDWEGEFLSGIVATDDLRKFVDDAEVEFFKGVEDFETKQPSWSGAHNIKGVALTLSFMRLAQYAHDVSRLRENISPRQVRQSVPVFKSLIQMTLDEARSRS